MFGSGLTFQEGSISPPATPPLTVSLSGAETVTAEQLEKALVSVQSSYPDNHFEQLSMSNVNPTISHEFFQKSWVTVAAAAF